MKDKTTRDEKMNRKMILGMAVLLVLFTFGCLAGSGPAPASPENPAPAVAPVPEPAPANGTPPSIAPAPIIETDDWNTDLDQALADLDAVENSG